MSENFLELMSSEPATYAFGPFVLDRSQRLLLRDGAEVDLTPKALDLLTVLVENEGRVVTKDELMTALWPDTAVEESNLTFQMSYLRKVLGGERLVTTIPGRGYQFTGRVQRVDARPVPLEPLQPLVEMSETIVESEERTTITVAERDAPRRLLIGAAALLVAAVILAAVAAVIVQMQRAAVAPGERSIAILPFKPIVATQRDEALELGMADTLITRLSHVPGVTIRPTSAVRRYSALDQDPLEAGRALEVASVLEGTIQRSGERMRVNVRLLRTTDGQTLWADQFDQPAAGLFAVQDRVADSVARALVPALSGRAQQRVAKRTTADLKAYDLYVKGSYWKDRDPNRALDFFQQATARDPRFAAAYAATAEIWMFRGRYSNSPPGEQFEHARAAAVKAIELDPELGEAHASLAAVYGDWDWAWDRAETEYRRALSLNPNWVPAHIGYANLLLVRRRFNAALQHTQRAVELDPTSPHAGIAHGITLRCTGRIDDSIAHLQEVLQVHPGLVPAYLHIGQGHLAAGRPAEAVAAYDLAMANRADSQQLGSLRALALARAGRREEAKQVLQKLEAEGRAGAAASVNLASAWLALGDRDRAFQWLDRAYQERLYLLRVILWAHTFDEIRTDPRYRELVRKMGL
ncbi:MAG TPA: winged helix-turn-helix domain-containing protein [Thermoanaerobaculia bacterium]|nr:winged helix-turn-helix domain-containing protein [Thermoanaerobaculia bacterium]